MIIAGVDPGLTGAVAVINFGKKRQLIDVIDFPLVVEGNHKILDIREISWKLSQYHIDLAVIERIQATPGDARHVVSFGKLMRSFGVLEALMYLVADRYVTVPPKTWKTRYGLSSDKSTSLNLVRKLYNDDKRFKRVKDHNRAEAALLAEYGYEYVGH
jgi:crossover junction endodeoxyribonuclease RuvC